MSDTMGAAHGRSDAHGRAVDVDSFRGALAEAGIEEVAGELIEEFLADAPGRLEALDQAVAAQDGVRIKATAHAYKSAAATMCATRLAELLKQTEIAGGEGEVAQATDLFEEIRAEHAAALRQLTELVESGR
jgi:HPt (histidine-containing phosphotransfer) domain-containing protein